MLTIYLPGFSDKNANELEEYTQALTAAGYPVHGVAWPHWHDENAEINWDKQAAQALEVIKQSDTDSWGVIGKSVGTFVACKLISLSPRKPRYVVLHGIPAGNLSAEDVEVYRSALAGLDAAIFVIQNSGDPYGGPAKLGELLTGIDYKLISKEADNHRYSYAADVVGLIKPYQD